MMRRVEGSRIWLSTVFDVRPGEAGLVGRVALLFALTEAARAFGEIGIDTLVSLRLGPQYYPSMFVVLGSVSLVVSLGYGAALGRLPRRPLLVCLVLGIAGLLFVGWIALGLAGDAVVPALWVAIFTSSALILTMTWTVAGAVFDTRQARRLFPLVTGAAIAGSLVGNLSVGPLAGLTGTESLILIEAILLIAASTVLSRMPLRTTSAGWSRHRSSVVAELRAGLDFVAGSPLMRLVALSYVLFSVLSFSVTFPYFTAMSSAFPDETEFATVNGLVQTGVTATSFVLTLLVASRLYARFGVSAGGLLLPVVYLAGFGMWIVSFSAATAILVRWIQQSTQRGLSNAAWSAFYNVVPAQRRAQVLAFNDGVPGQIGIILSGLLLIATQRLLGLEQVFWLGAATAAACTIVVIAIRRRYAASLVAALRSGLAEQVLEGGLEPTRMTRDPEFVQAMRTTLQDPDPAVRRMAATLLGRTPTPAARHSLMQATHDSDAGVRACALQALVADGPQPDCWPGVVGALVDPSPSVRAVAAAALARARDPRGPAAIRELLAGGTQDEHIGGLVAAAAAPDAVDVNAIRVWTRSPHAVVRESAVRALAAATWGAGEYEGDLLAALDDPAPSVGSAAAQGLATIPQAQPALLRVLDVGTARAQESVVMALGQAGEAARAEVAGWALHQVTRAQALRQDASALRDDPGDEVRRFLVHALDRRIRHLEERAVLAVAALGSPGASGVLRRSLRAPDPDVRAQAIETLDSLGDRRLGRALASLLEDAPGPSTAAVDEALARLARDSDGWIRWLAAACGAGGDRDRARSEEEASPMPSASLADLQTMIALRRVPLFRGLDPEDLYRLARVAEDCWYPYGTALMQEGELGDELVVIIEGSVRVMQVAADGRERFVRRYGPGEHIGELAVLRERPRAATVIAEEAGVRGLVIGGAGLKALMRERPEAAMAMLATLAERIATQS